jgi:hypothetical protein
LVLRKLSWLRILPVGVGRIGTTSAIGLSPKGKEEYGSEFDVSLRTYLLVVPIKS